MLRDGIQDKNNRTCINDSESNIRMNNNKAVILSSSLSSVVEEYEEKRNSPLSDRSQRRKRSVQQPPSSPSCGYSCNVNKNDTKVNSSSNDGTKQTHRSRHHHTKAVHVSDNAKMAAIPLRKWSARLQKYEADYDDIDKRDLSATEIETDDDDDFGLAVQNRDSVDDHDHCDDAEQEDIGLPKSSFLTEFRKSESFVLRKHVVFADETNAANKHSDKLQDHRWSPYGGPPPSAMQRLPGATACVDDLPKQCKRRPSL